MQTATETTVGHQHETMAGIVWQLRSVAIRALERMYRPDEHLFAFRIRRTGEGSVMEGTSRRYTATVLIALANEPEDIVSRILAGQNPADVCGRLLKEVDAMEDLGEIALTLWAARALNHPDAAKALNRLREMDPLSAVCRTVELAWLLTVLMVDGSDVTDEKLAKSIADRVLSAFRTNTAMFAHWPDGLHRSTLNPFRALSYYRRSTANWARHGAQPNMLHGHITSFADMVYPILGLAHFYRSAGNNEARDIASRCAQRMCELQGPAGQWWWHFDVRTGRMLEQYPVYAVHQDAMAPMALFAVRDVCGSDHNESIERGLNWLVHPPETTHPLIDFEEGVIWRKVDRYEPARLARGLQALASSVHPSLRVPSLDAVLKPGRIEYESRPYHMAWILHAWSGNRQSVTACETNEAGG